MSRRRRRGRSIFVDTLLLLLGVIVAMAAVNVGLILLRPPPRSAPLTAYEVARLLGGREIARPDPSILVRRTAAAPAAPRTEHDRLVALAMARFLGRPAGEVRFAMAGRIGPGPRRLAPRPGFRDGIAESARRQYVLYGHDGQFNPLVLGPFQAAVRQADGQWRVASRSFQADSLRAWQATTLLWILISALLAILVAWLFSKRLARPIRELAAAARQLGDGHRPAPIPVAGPVEVAQAAAALNDMHEQIQRHVGERTSMVGAIAHDLRTPLSRLHFHLAAAPEEVRSKAESELAEMEAMIATTLDFVQSETRHLQLEPTDLASLLEGLVDDYADTGRPALLSANGRAIVQGDPILLKRLFANLIDNATAYGRGAAVTMRVERRDAVVEVLDEGPGLSAEDRLRAFEPFYRAESSRNRATGGIGLGLAIARMAAERHGGTVELADRAEGGLCARVRLPLA